MNTLTLLLTTLCTLLLVHTATATVSPRKGRIFSPTPPPPATPTHLPTYPPLNRLADNLRSIPYPTPPLPLAVYLYSQDDYTPADFYLLLTLQGSLAKLNAQRDSNTGPSRSDVLLFHVTGNRSEPSSPEWVYWEKFQLLFTGGGVIFNEQYLGAPVSELLKVASGRLTGYYLTELHTDSVNVGVSLAGVTTGTIAVTPAHIKLMAAFNIPLIEDVRNVTEQQFIGRYLSTDTTVLPSSWPFSTRFIACEVVDKSTTSLTDWSMLIGAITIHRTDTYQRLLPLLHAAHSPPQFNVVFGWVTDGSAEHDYTGNASEWGAGVLASDWLNNGATHASLQLPTPLHNPTRTNPTHLPNNTARHTVAVVFTDGDNICSDLNLLLDAQHWAHPRRGDIAIGWGVNPTLALTAPVGLLTYYQQANAAMDGFVGFSSTYAFPEAMPAGGVAEWAEATGAAMAAADIRVVNFIGNSWNESYWSPLLQQHNIDGAIYFGTHALTRTTALVMRGSTTVHSY